MNHRQSVTMAVLVGLMLAACSPAQEIVVSASSSTPESAAPQSAGAGTGTDTVTEIALAELPGGVAALVQNTIPGMKIAEVQRKTREGRVYFDVEGTRPDGSEVELDILQEGDLYKVVEIQRDIAWAEVPPAARTAAEASAKAVTPVRVIESTQTDGTIIYELFAQGKPAKPSLEVALKDGKAQVLTQEWPH